MSIQKELRRLSGLDRDQAHCANALAGTSGLELVGALNAAAGTSGLELNGVCQKLALQNGGNPNLDAVGALASIVSFSQGEGMEVLGFTSAFDGESMAYYIGA